MTKPHHWTTAEVRVMYCLRDTHTMQEIGDVYGISKQRIEQLLRGHEFPKKPRRQSTEMILRSGTNRRARELVKHEGILNRSNRLHRVDLACEDYKRGWGYNNLMEKYHLGQETLLRPLRRRGLMRTRAQQAKACIRKTGRPPAKKTQDA